MGSIPYSSFVALCATLFFVWAQEIHFRDFRGASKVFEGVLALLTLAGKAAVLAYILFVGFTVSWGSAVMAVIGGLIATSMASRVLGAIVPVPYISVIGLLGLPVSAFLMFYLL